MLTKDEEVVTHLHPHWKALIRPMFVVILGIAAVVLAEIFLPTGSRMIGLYVVGAIALVAVAWLASGIRIDASDRPPIPLES